MLTLRKKYLRGLAIIVAALFLFGAGLAFFLVPHWLRPKVEAAVPGLEVGSLGLGLFPPRVWAREVRFRQGDPRDSALVAEARAVEVPISFANVFPGPWRIGLVEASGVSVLVHEGDAHFPRPPEGPEKPGIPYVCQGIRVREAAFTYRKDSSAGSAFLRLPEVTAEAQPFGSVGEWRKQPAAARAVARLEQSGKVDLRVRAWFFEGRPHTEVDLQVTGQRLAEVNEYFRPEEGVDLKGTLLKSHALVKVEGPRAEGTVEAEYEGLDISFHPNRHRGGLKAVLNNLGVQLKVNHGNSGAPRADQEQAVVTQRHPRESLVSFILRTMKEAVLRVATK